MPSVLRPCGVPFIRKGATEPTQPMALVSFCEDCGWEGAPFGETVDGKLRRFCGWGNNRPTCINRGEK